jgi:hypothetical protein
MIEPNSATGFSHRGRAYAHLKNWEESLSVWYTKLVTFWSFIRRTSQMPSAYLLMTQNFIISGVVWWVNATSKEPFGISASHYCLTARQTIMTHTSGAVCATAS